MTRFRADFALIFSHQHELDAFLGTLSFYAREGERYTARFHGLDLTMVQSAEPGRMAVRAIDVWNPRFLVFVDSGGSVAVTDLTIDGQRPAAFLTEAARQLSPLGAPGEKDLELVYSTFVPRSVPGVLLVSAPIAFVGELLKQVAQDESPRVNAVLPRPERRADAAPSERSAFCRQYASLWEPLAAYFDIPLSDRRRFRPGAECEDVWDWLAERQMLAGLEMALVTCTRRSPACSS